MSKIYLVGSGVGESKGTVPIADGAGDYAWDHVTVEEEPWLGLNGNHFASSNFSGPQTLFSQKGTIVWTRLDQRQGDVDVGDGTDTLANWLNTIESIGQKPVVILEPTAYDTGVAYPTDPAVISSFASWVVSTIQTCEAAHPDLGILYEIDNEPWGFYTGGQATGATYGAVVVAVLNAAQAANLDLTRMYVMIKDASWVAAMYAAQPTLQTLVQGWTIHPYGPPPPGYAASTGQGIASVPHIRDTITGSGADNILLSEIGFLSPGINGQAVGDGLSNAMSDTQAGQWMDDMLALAQEYRNAGWLKALLVYHRSDAGWSMVQANTNGTLTAQGQALMDFPTRPRGWANQAYSPKAPGVWLPYDDGALATTIKPEAARDAVQLSGTGVIHFFRIRIDVYEWVAHITVWLDASNNASLTAGQCFVGLYKQVGPTGTTNWWLEQVSADMQSTWNGTATGRKVMAVAANNSTPGYYWIAILANGTTMPKFRGVIAGDVLNFGNFGVLPQRSMITAANGHTSLPANLDLSSGTIVTAWPSTIFAAITS